MTILVKNCFGSYQFYNESKKLVCKIKSLKIIGPQKEVFDSKGKLVFTTDIQIADNGGQMNPSKYVSYFFPSTSKVAATATLELDGDERASLPVKLPAVIGLCIKSVYGDIKLKKIRNRELSIFSGRQEIGHIVVSPFYKASLIDCETIDNAEFLAVLFVFSIYMIHEDDVYIV